MEWTPEGLEALGFSPFFRQQLDLEQEAQCRPARVFTVDRRALVVLDGEAERRVAVPGRLWAEAPEERPTVGDWVVLEPELERVRRVLERKSLFKRLAAGLKVEVQLIAANVDTLLVVSSCNAEFNLSRLERYLALAFEAGVTPVIVLTKADLAADAGRYREQVLGVGRDLVVELVDARDGETLKGVRAWCGRGQTVALVGSSGVGKSTLLNSLAGETLEATGAIRAADQRGRHTTTHRSLHRLADGGLLLDSPGMRELKLADAEAGVEAAFEDVGALARACRFRDCGHTSEPGCAVLEALASGQLDERRLVNYRKLLREQLHARESIAERNARLRRFARNVRARLSQSDKRR